jgi:hypothetical protein
MVGSRGVMTDTNDGLPAKKPLVRRAAIYAAVIVAAFLAGLVPMWMSARERATERDAAQQALRLTQIENVAGAAAIQARRGSYEPAREAASTFYTLLVSELDRAESGFPAPQHDALRTLLAERDEIITLLARGDPSAAERLAATYVSYRQATGTLPPTVSPAEGGR